MALQLAVQDLESGRDHARQDLTPQVSAWGRFFKFVLVLVIGLPIGIILFHRVIAPFIPRDYHVWAPMFEKLGLDTGPPAPGPLPSATADDPLDRRRMIPPGKELLRVELEDPLAGAETRIEVSLKVIGDEKQAMLETIIAESDVVGARKKAYELWTSGRFNEAKGNRLALLKRVYSVKKKRASVVRYLQEDLIKRPPSDKAMSEALAWAPKDLWRLIVKRLGRGGKGAEGRSKTLTKELKNDTKELHVLRALIRTGYAGPEALNTLVAKRGLKWCQGKEGRALLVSIVAKFPDAADGLLTHEDVELAAFVVDVIGDAGGAPAISKLIQIMRNKGPSPYKEWIRQKATRALRKSTPAGATWALVYVLNTADTPPQLLLDVQRALKAYPGEEGVRNLERYTTSGRSSTRRYAIKGLAAMATPDATQRLVERLQEESDYRVRRLIVTSLGELQKVKSVLTTLRRGIATFRKIMRNDRDAAVRKEAERLYRSLSGG